MTGAPGAALLDISDLRVAFRRGAHHVQAVDGLSLSVGAGESVAVVGESGSGKSVTALAVLRLFTRSDGATVQGTMSWRGETLDEPALRRLRGREIAMIFQAPGASLDPVFTVGAQLVETLRRHRSLRGAAARVEAAALLRAVGLPDPEQRLRAFPHQLSGGMRQRVAIAIALACRPALLIADEPTTALNVTIQAQLIRLLREVRGRLGMALLFITHDLDLVADIADRVVVMYAGEAVESGPADAVLAAPAHPYTSALLACRPRPGGGLRPGFAPIPGVPPRTGAHPPSCRFAPRCPLAEAACRAAPVALRQIAPLRAARCLYAMVPA